ncbi:MAG: MotA/TolQ/ExbB proton channel family protein [Nitrospirae bacterium]|nr:MotA/TolQ/ExbB proton channel family protein [Nitrospirota bacterium]
MEMIEFLVANFKSGGIFMYGILLVLVVGTAIVVERALALVIRGRVNARAFWRELEELIGRDKLADALQHAATTDAPLARVLAAGLASAHRGEGREAIERGMEETVREVLPQLEKRIHYLYTLSNVSTLVGLLGTVVGLITAFTAVSLADPAQKAALLANGISLALNNTAFGLMVAILLMLTYSFMQSRAARIGDEIDEFSLRLANRLVARTDRR